MENKFCEICNKIIRAKNKKVALRKNAATCSTECRVIKWAKEKEKVLVGKK